MRWVIAAIIAVGVGIRLGHLLGARSLHIDEARLALNIAQRSFGQLLLPLSYEQSAPLPFLFAEKAIVLAVGVSDIALRLVPFACGVGLLVAVYHLAKRVLPEQGVALVAALAAVSPVLVHYSNEVKPYMGDALACALLTIIALDLTVAPTTRSWHLFLAIGTAALLASAPAIFVLLGLSGVLVVSSHRAHPWLARRIFFGALLWGLTCAAMYVMFYRPASTLPYMRQFWEPGFLTPAAGPILPRVWGMAREMAWGTMMGGYVHAVKARDVLWTVGFATGVLGAATLVGLVHLWRTQGRIKLSLLVAPAAVTLMAAAAGAYPISLRLVLYLVPSLLVVVAAGVIFTVAGLPRGESRIAFTLVSAALLLRPLLRSTVPEFWPYHRQELRPLVEYLHARSGSSAIYVFANAIPAWLYYTTDWSAPDTSRLNWYARMASAGGPAFENAAPRSRPVEAEGAELQRLDEGRLELLGVSTGDQWRVIVGSKRRRPDDGWEVNEAKRILGAPGGDMWLVFSHYRGSENVLLDELERRGARQVVAEKRIGAAAFLYLLPR